MKKLYRLTALMLALMMLCASALAEAAEAPAQTEAAETETVETDAVEAETGEAELPDPEEVEALEAEAEEGPAEAADAPVELWFDAGFALTLPGNWVSYEVADADKTSGLEYALGDGSGERYLYIYLTPTTLEDFDAVSGAVEADAALSRTGSLSFDGADPLERQSAHLLLHPAG